MVISYKINESAMGNRVTKQVDSKNLTVKAQRIDGGYLNNYMNSQKGLLSCSICEFYRFTVKVYSTGLRKKLSKQNPF